MWRLGVCIVVLIFLPSRRLTSVLACINRPSMAILVRISSLVSCSDSTWLGVGRYAPLLVTDYRLITRANGCWSFISAEHDCSDDPADMALDSMLPPLLRLKVKTEREQYFPDEPFTPEPSPTAHTATTSPRHALSARTTSG